MPAASHGVRPAEFRRLPRTVEDHLLDTMDRVDDLERDLQDLRERLAVFERIKHIVVLILSHGAEIMKSLLTLAALVIAFTGHLPIEQAADLLRRIAELWVG